MPYELKQPLWGDVFTTGYVEALYFTEEEQLKEEGADLRYLPHDFDPGAVQKIKDDCAAFQTRNAALLVDAYYLKDGYDLAAAGRDFWYTRNGHGVGYWDRGLGEVGQKLTEACKKFSEQDVYLGSDGRLHVSGGSNV